MIFYWIILALRKAKLLFMLPKPRDVARIRPDVACPICGARRGRLRAVSRTKDINSVRSKVILCQHTCGVCGAKWFEDPVLNVKPNQVEPAIARNKLEELEDSRTLTR